MKKRQLGASLQSFLNIARCRVVGIQSYWRKNKEVKAKINMSSGILLTNELLLTSAHNIYVNDFKTIASDIRIIIMEEDDDRITDRNMSLLIKPKLNENVIIQFRQGKEQKGYSLDLALIRLKKLQVFKEKLNLWLELFDKIDIQQKQVIVCGFPDYKAAQNQNLKSLKQEDVLTKLKIERGVIQKSSDNYLYYNKVETVVGQSGGPIFVYHQQQFYLIGIHSEFNEKGKKGKGILLTQLIRNRLWPWCQTLKASLSFQSTDLSKSFISPNSTKDSSGIVSFSNDLMQNQDTLESFYQFYQQKLQQFSEYFKIVDIDSKD